MKVEVVDEQVAGVRGDPVNPESRGFLCLRGRAAGEIIASTVWMRAGWLGINRLTSSARVVPDAAVAAFPQSGSARYDAFVECSAA
jgi:hypothetical protein